jgi:hypothetical protein
MRASRGPRSMATPVIGTDSFGSVGRLPSGKWSKTTTIRSESVSSVTTLVRFRPNRRHD